MHVSMCRVFVGGRVGCDHAHSGPELGGNVCNMLCVYAHVMIYVPVGLVPVPCAFIVLHVFHGCVRPLLLWLIMYVCVCVSVLP